jgi:hypothetical protein
VAKIRAWLQRELADLTAYSQDLPVQLHRNKPLVIDQTGFFPAARGLFWDLRGPRQILMRCHDAGILSLNAAAIRAAVSPDYPNQELLDCITFGVRMQAAHQYLVVLLSNLLSLADGLNQFTADITRMERMERWSGQACSQCTDSSCSPRA